MIVNVQRVFGYDGEESGSPVKINVGNLKSLHRTLRRRFALNNGWSVKLSMSRSTWKALGGYTISGGVAVLDGGDVLVDPMPVKLEGSTRH